MRDDSPKPWFSIWQNNPAFDLSVAKFNALWIPCHKEGHNLALQKVASIGSASNTEIPQSPKADMTNTMTALFKMWGIWNGKWGPVLFQVPTGFDLMKKLKSVGALIMFMVWHHLFANVPCSKAVGVIVIFQTPVIKHSPGTLMVLKPRALDGQVHEPD